jgi:hypothetical protein
MDDAHDLFLGVSHSKTKPAEKPFLPKYTRVLKLREGLIPPTSFSFKYPKNQ